VILEDLRAEIAEIDTTQIGHEKVRRHQQRVQLEILAELERRAFSDEKHTPIVSKINDEPYVMRGTCSKCELPIESMWLDFGDDRLPEWSSWSYVTWRKNPNGRVARHYGCAKKENA
jgi:hypothetical protein